MKVVFVKISQAFHFEAAHLLPNVAEEHRCRRLHGHSYRVELRLQGLVDPLSGFVADFLAIEAAFKPSFDRLDHNYWNDIEGLENPGKYRNLDLGAHKGGGHGKTLLGCGLAAVRG
jgi:6-pyruvoyl tetrahydropterin synthase/QueD family protein